MKPEKNSKTFLAITRSKGKMYEYTVPLEHHIDIKINPDKLFTLAIGILGDLAAEINRKNEKSALINERQQDLIFSAHFFDAYLKSKLNEDLDPYLILLGAASYYLCDLPGSSIVLAKQLGSTCPNIEGDGLEDLLLWLLQGDLSSYLDGSEGSFGKHIDSISYQFFQFFEDGTGIDKLFNMSAKMRSDVYNHGTPRQLLFGDIIAAILEKKYYNSSWHTIPLYSGMAKERWLHAFQKKTFIKELWPAQHLIGKAGVLIGKSAVIQMPTSAGKTKATELIIRSAFIADRTSLTVIVAPFRALCHEIKNSLVTAFYNENIKIDELSDVQQTDFDILQLLENKQVLVVTPEKFLYVLRHAPELAAKVGLAIFDEGHQFDSGIRGITYELLLTSLRLMLPGDAQKILISAVISNASAVGEWLNGADSAVISGSNLMPTLRSVGFASWLDQLGRIEYVSDEDIEIGTFFVPRVIESYRLKRKKKESKTKIRVFPDKSIPKDVGKEIALYLGLKLVSQGSVAIFCGRKDTASGLCEMIHEKFSRGLSLPKPNEYSNSKEVAKLYSLHSRNLGAEAPATKSAQLGIFSHHGNTPHGIRLAVEYSMREGLIRFVICTSTLAQGVNLPIRYLIVTSIYQGQEQIKVRDFHNLIGRVGRAGMHTEGSILFTDPVIYDKRNTWEESFRWGRIKELLDPSNSERCLSSLFDLIPLTIKNDRSLSIDKKDHSLTWELLPFTSAYIKGWDELNKVIDQIVKANGQLGFTEKKIRQQFKNYGNTLAAIESFLLSNWDTAAGEISEVDVIRLAEQTLAHFLADDAKREEIKSMFKLIAGNISKNTNNSKQRVVYGRSLYGIRDAKEIDAWVQNNIEQLLITKNDVDFIKLVWSLLSKYIRNSIFNKCDKPETLKDIAQEWIQGKNFYELFDILQTKKAKLFWGTKRREFKIDHVVEICENGLAYDGSLLIGALCEFTELSEKEETGGLINRLQLFQKRLKYGLPTELSICLYELGFSDRVIAMDLASIFNSSVKQSKDVISILKNNANELFSFMEKYPAYFYERFKEIIS